MSSFRPWLNVEQPDGTKEASPDAMQLLTIATFNGLCHVITALGQQGLLDVRRIDGLHDAMASPLDDESCRDDDFLAGVRDTLEEVLADVMKLARNNLRIDR